MRTIPIAQPRPVSTIDRLDAQLRVLVEWRRASAVGELHMDPLALSQRIDAILDARLAAQEDAR